MTTDLSHIASLARDATPGAREIINGIIWIADRKTCVIYASATAECPRAGDYYGCTSVRAEAKLHIRDADRDFIAILSPEVVLELVAMAKGATEALTKIQGIARIRGTGATGIRHEITMNQIDKLAQQGLAQDHSRATPAAEVAEGVETP